MESAAAAAGQRRVSPDYSHALTHFISHRHKLMYDLLSIRIAHTAPYPRRDSASDFAGERRDLGADLP